MSERVVIQSADFYSITDDKTGVVNQIHQIIYFNQYRDSSDSAVGSKPIKVNATPEAFQAVLKAGAPSVYDIDFSTRPGAGGKPTLIVTGVKQIKAIDMNLLLGLAAPRPEAKAA